MKKINSDIKNKEFERVYLLTGTEAYLRSFYKKKLVEAACGDADKMNISEFDGKGISVRELIDLADTVPFFAEHRAITITASGFFKGSADDELVEYMSQIPPDTIIIFDEEKVDARSRMYKAVNKNGYCAKLDTPDTAQLNKWIAGILARDGKKIRRNTVEFLTGRVGTDMAAIRNELEKLVVYSGDREEITEQDVISICSLHIENAVFAMLDAMIDKDRDKAMRLYDGFLKAKESPHSILMLLSRQFSLLYQTKQLSVHTRDANAIGKVIGLYPGIARNYIMRSDRMDLAYWRSAVENCAETTYNIQTGRISEELGVELIIIRTILGAR
ncbi:MAG: DNA polymerase III subunit delta [Lachnospiraceae bacterium]|nr:DNA polymerase III subunit delta [Lachnospiraceae bacterium]